MKRILLLTSLALLLPNPAAWAERIELTNGSVFVGTLVRQDETSVTLRTSLGEIKFARTQIQRLEGVPPLTAAPVVTKPVRETVEPSAPPDPAPSREVPEPPEAREELRREIPVPPRPIEESPRRIDRGFVAPDPAPVLTTPEETPAETESPADVEFPSDEGVPPAPRDFLPLLKTALGRPDAAWGIGFLAGVFVVYLVASFAVAVLIALGVSRMMSSIQEPTFGNALKVCAIQWVAAIVIVGVCGMILGVLGATSDPRQLAVAGTGACCAVPVVIVILAAVNIGTVARIFNLGFGSAFVFVLGQGFFGWVADLLLRQVVVGVLRG